MLNNYIPNSELAFIIGDGGLSRASPAPTVVGGQKVFACLELQSTTRADVFIKPKTDIQIAAINNPTKGMIAFSSNSNTIVVNDGTTWNALTPPAPPPPPAVLYSEIIVSHSTLVNTLFNELPVDLLPAPGVGFYYNIVGWSILRSAGNSTINMNSGKLILMYDNGDFAEQAAIIDNDVMETSPTIVFVDYAPGAMANDILGSALAMPQLDNRAIALQIFGADASITGGSTYLSVRIWYSILPSTF
jgi:hypothetical protein